MTTLRCRARLHCVCTCAPASLHTAGTGVLQAVVQARTYTDISEEEWVQLVSSLRGNWPEVGGGLPPVFRQVFFFSFCFCEFFCPAHHTPCTLISLIPGMLAVLRGMLPGFGWGCIMLGAGGGTERSGGWGGGVGGRAGVRWP